MIRKSGHRFFEKIMRKIKREKTGMTRPTAKEIKAMSDVAGVPVDNDVAARIANSIGPAFEGFAPVAGTLPFDLEPATYRLVHAPKVTK